jgi:hypothetical protein
MANFWHNLWLQTGKKDHQYFMKYHYLHDKIQKEILMKYLLKNKETTYGKLHNFGKIKSVAEYRKNVPVIEDFGMIQKYIDQISQGHQRILTEEPVLAFESTSGSTGKAKLIPYTGGLKKEFQKAIHIWMNELNWMRPKALAGKAYWSISPPLKDKYTTEGGIPVGLESDDEYFDPVSRFIINRIMAVGKNVLQSKDFHEFYLNSTAQLLACDTLSFISVWNPSFIIKSDHFIQNNLDEILAKSTLPKAKKEALVRNGFYWKNHFTNLDTLSCWTDGQAKMWLPQLEKMFDGIHIQPKGLLSTEGVITTPTRFGNTLAYTSHFYEFRNIRTGEIFDSSDLLIGEKYEVILTNGGGLYRYNTRDVVLVTKLKPLPILQFTGRSGNVVDMVGEKVDALSVQILSEILMKEDRNLQSVLLSPYKDEAAAGYELLLISDHITDFKTFERKASIFLNENPYYKQAVDINQLKPLCSKIVSSKTLLEILVNYGQYFQIRDGDVKLPVLLPVNFFRKNFRTDD